MISFYLLKRISIDMYSVQFPTYDHYSKKNVHDVTLNISLIHFDDNKRD